MRFCAIVFVLLTWLSMAAHVVDTCGVVRLINETSKNVYIVITGHYSTEDDGYTENFDGVETVLNTLKRKQVKAAFFPTAITMAQPRYEASIRRIIADGHYLSAHSYAHLLLCDTAGLTLVTRDSVVADLHLQEQQLNRFGLVKHQYQCMIPPYETCNRETAQYYRDDGYLLLSPTDGIFTGQDWTRPGTKGYWSAQRIIDQLWDYERKHTLNGVILLIHAMNYPWRDANDRPYNYLGEIIDTLRSKGYIPSPLDLH